MNSITSGFALSLVVMSTLVAQARPKPTENISETIRNKPPIIRDSSPINRTRIGERYRLWMSFNPTDCNDPMYPGKSNPYDDHKFECYGQLKLNGQVVWYRSKNDAKRSDAKVAHRDIPAPLTVNPRTQGYRLNRNPLAPRDPERVFEYDALDGQTAASTVKVSLKLYDLDNPIFYDEGPYNSPPDRNDDMFGDFNINVNLLKMGKGNYYWFWQGQDESGNTVGSNLYLYIEHVKTLYASNSALGSKPEVGPVIEKPIIPGRVPSPGPVIKRGRLKTLPR